ncbi:MAG: FAD-binding protein [bacterium]|nr:FAD-binding protein [bacterium]
MNDVQTVLLRALADRLGPGGLLTGSAALSVYSRDASHLSGGRPLAVALPASEEDIAHVIGLCAAAGVPVVARGAGTGLSGGAVPCEDALVLGTARLVALGPVDAVVDAVRAQPGVLNATLTRRAAPHGLHFAPDPSSQVASTIGGNIAENAGGPHCLRLGVTSHHLRALDWCDARGRNWTTGEPVAVSRGIDLRGLLCGSEGTLGIVTGAWLQLTATPPAVATLLASFPVLEHATAAVPRLLQAGLLPVAVEIIDQAMVLTVEEAFGFGLPCDVEAVMIAELAGDAAAVGAQADLAARILGDAGARDVRRAADEEQRLALWQCRKRAFGAVGRLSPNYVSMDIVVPLGELPGLVREIQDVRRESGLKIATAFHAGDGNLHPAVHYDERREGETVRAHAVADTIIRAALRRRGSVTGEHGVGLEKRHALPWQIDAVTASLLHGIKAACDPDGLLNPGKALPVLGPAASFASLPPAPADCRFAWDDLTVSAPVATPLASLQAAALARGLWLPLGLAGSGDGPGLEAAITLAELTERLLVGPLALARATARDLLLEAWATTGDGRPFHVGAPVFKNVAGYDLPRLLCGSDGRLARLQAVTLQLRPAPVEAWAWRLEADPEREGAPGAAAALLAALAAGGDGLAGNQAIITRDPTGRWRQAVLLAAGEATAHAALDTSIAGLSTALGCSTVATLRVPFAEALGLARSAGAPDWALAGPDWTALQPLPGRHAGALPAGPTRLVWQAHPQLAWCPGVTAPPGGWYADVVIADGRPQPLPKPAAGVPVALLRRLKRCFDPDATLGGPDWMLEGADD